MLTVMVASFVLVQAGAPSWNLVEDTERGRFSYDASSLRVDQNRVTVLAQYENMTMPGGVTRSDMEMIIDCTSRTYAFVRGRAYNAAGAVLHSREVPAANVTNVPIAPNSTEDRLRARVCPAA